MKLYLFLFFAMYAAQAAHIKKIITSKEKQDILSSLDESSDETICEQIESQLQQIQVQINSCQQNGAQTVGAPGVPAYDPCAALEGQKQQLATTKTLAGC